MTSKEKANDILDNFWLLDKVKPMLIEKQAKQCAIIAVDELIKNAPWGGIIDDELEINSKEYFIKVKKLLQKLKQFKL